MLLFDGSGTLGSAFILNDVTGVEIFGITIRDYEGYGIYVAGGSANRFISNTIYDIGFRGIILITSSFNVIWRNWIRNTADGVYLFAASTSNYLIENFIRDCSNDGFESFLPADANNVLKRDVT